MDKELVILIDDNSITAEDIMQLAADIQIVLEKAGYDAAVFPA